LEGPKKKKTRRPNKKKNKTHKSTSPAVTPTSSSMSKRWSATSAGVMVKA
jgi:hypothetical protein